MSSSSSAAVRVEKATSDLLIGPDWTLNMEICDSVNSDHWLAKDVMKAVKKRLQHKSPNVQFLALTLLETMIKNCGDFVHFQVVEREILQEMTKIVRKKTDMRVRDKILVLLDSWQEAFGGSGGKYPQYYLAYAELKGSGVQFPSRSPDSALIFSPPSHARPAPIQPQIGYGMPSSSALRLEEAMASEMANLSISDLGRMRSVMELLSDMLKAINPNDQMAVQDEVIIDLVTQCRSNQKKLMQLIDSTRDEELLAQGLELNDNLQTLLTKHDSITSGSPLPTETSESIPGPSTAVSPPVVTHAYYDEEEDEDDEFAQLARRSSKLNSAGSDGTPLSTSHQSSAETVGNVATSATAPSSGNASSPVAGNELVLADPPTPIRTSNKEQDIVDLLSLALSSNQSPPRSPLTPPASNQTGSPSPLNFSEQGHIENHQTHAVSEAYSPQSYVAPWAISQPHSSPQPQSQPQISYGPSNYIPPPWDITPHNNNPFAPNAYQIPAATSYPSVHASRPLQNYGSLGSKVTGVQAIRTEAQASSSVGQTAPTNAPKPYVYTNRLFNELMDLRNADGSLKSRSSTSSSNDSSSQGLMGGRK